VPIGGKTLPIVFDFTQCVPLNGITYTLNATTSANTSLAESTFAFLTGTTQTSTSSQSLSGGNFATPRLTFQGIHTNKSETTASTTYVNLNVAISGTDAAYFNIPTVIGVTRIIAPTATPVAKSVVATPIAGSVSFAFTCDQVGTAYYVWGLNSTTTSSFNATYIQNLTFAQGIRNVPATANDTQWTGFGFQEINTANTAISTTSLSPVRASGNYTVSFFCLNQVDNPSSINTINWTQTTNNAQTVTLLVSFSRQLTRAEHLKITCAIGKTLNLPLNRV
jgi:hypothetical protein